MDKLSKKRSLLQTGNDDNLNIGVIESHEENDLINKI